MKNTIFSGLILCWLLASFAFSADEAEPVVTAAQLRAGVVVSTSCGECQFGLDGDSCDLAVQINGRAYFVVGTGIDDHGDAHASDGFCSAVRLARVTGSIIDGKFHATSFVLLEEERTTEPVP